MVIVCKIKPAQFIGGKIYYENKICLFEKNNKYHRYYGPAAILIDEKSWWFNDKYYGSTKYNYNQKQFIKNLNKEFLK